MTWRKLSEAGQVAVKRVAKQLEQQHGSMHPVIAVVTFSQAMAGDVGLPSGPGGVAVEAKMGPSPEFDWFYRNPKAC